MRRLLIGGALGVVVVFLAACADSTTPSAAQQALQRKADMWDIDQLEKNFHQATTMKDIDLMMSLFSPNATLTAGPGKTATGLDEIQRYWLEKSVAFQPETHWISDHPAYKLEITVDGDRGTLHFECHFIDYDTGRVESAVVGDQYVARLDGRWLVTSMIAGTTTLSP